jgi:hypothetical protein
MKRFFLFFARIVFNFFDWVLGGVKFLIEIREKIWIVVFIPFIYVSAIYLGCSREQDECSFLERGEAAAANNNYSSALFFYNLSLLIEGKDSDKLSSLYLARSKSHKALGDTVAAKADYFKALMKDSTIIEYLSFSYDTSYSANSLNELQILNFAVDRFSNWYLPYFKRGQFRFYKGESAQSVIDYKRALEIDSTKTFINSWIFAAQKDLGNYNEVIKYCSKMLDYSPGNQEYLRERGRAKIQIGDTLNGCIDLLKSRDSSLEMSEKLLINKLFPD